MMEETGWKHYLRLILNIVIPLTGWLLICLLGPKLLKFFMPFVIGWVIAMIANPLVRFLERRVKLVRRHSSIVIVAAALPPAFCQLLLTLSESLPAAASAGTPFLAPGWYGFCLVSFFPHAPLPFYVFQQSPHLALPIYSNPVFLQTCGTDTVPFCKGAGKCAVIDLPASAGRASLL